ncbi:MAG: hypothetical protein EBU01_02690 [Crocinitomicaceae bacterium]|nr:hypothetical protein [Crocinitomicaceae bacterium]
MERECPIIVRHEFLLKTQIGLIIFLDTFAAANARIYMNWIWLTAQGHYRFPRESPLKIKH